MDIRQQLPLEQQFELRVFEAHVRTLSQDDAHSLLIQLQEAMFYQATTFRKILKESWEIGKDVDLTLELLSER